MTGHLSTEHLGIEENTAQLTFTDEVFSKDNKNESSGLHKKISKTNGLRMGAMLGVIRDIQKIQTYLEDHVDVRNEP